MFRQIAPEGVVRKEVAAAAAASGCPVMSAYGAGQRTAVADSLTEKLEQHSLEDKASEPALSSVPSRVAEPQVSDDLVSDTSRETDKASGLAFESKSARSAEAQVSDNLVLDTAREADKAVLDENARLGADTTASEADPANGEIPRANAE